MIETPTILIAEDDDGHAFLVEDNLRHAGVNTTFLRFADGQDILDFLMGKTTAPKFEPGRRYLLLLDIRMPKVEGIEVLRRIKLHPELRKIPVVMLTTTEDPRAVARCHDLGCNIYIQKPVSWDSFAAAINHLGKFLCLLQVPAIEHRI